MAARPTAAARNLSLTEELERLEQSITLTLQEIDHNFSKSHRIVTASILPIVEQYGEHSRNVWEASKFWKQFFEASANVSLSGYEELANDEGTTAADESSAVRDDTTADYTAQEGPADVTATPNAGRSNFHGEDESMLDEGEITGSTPRVPPTNTIRGEFSGLESPYEAMKREMKNEEGDSTALHSGGEEEEDDSTILFAQRTARLPDMAMTPSRDASTVKDQSTLHGNKDPLLHRVLDKNYRIQATPHKPASRMSPVRGSSHKKLQPWQDSPMSSPEMAVPQLRSEAFMSPFKSNARQRLAAATQQQAPRTPGVSVQTPGTQRGKTRDVFAPTGTPGGKGKEKDEIDWDDEDEGDLDLYGGMSPPKTIQFALPPSKLLQTPAKQATRQIVDSILLDAGADPESSEFSPTMVKLSENVLDDSF